MICHGEERSDEAIQGHWIASPKLLQGATPLANPGSR